MKTTLIKELPLIIIMLVPIIYLLTVWNILPDKIPMHYDVHGNINGYESKMSMLLTILLITIPTYLILLFIPRFDPKGKIDKMGSKYTRLKYILIIFLSGLSSYMIYLAKRGTNSPPNDIFVPIGLLLAALGNYFQTVQPNYFIGIRTPWTLENETVWRDTHRLGGKIWMAGGLVIAIAGYFINPKHFMLIFISILAVMVLVPVIYSFKRFQAVKSKSDKG
jgi:uncharacterized membrane protein